MLIASTEQYGQGSPVLPNQIPVQGRRHRFPLYVCGILGWGHYDLGSGLTCHAEAMCRMIKARKEKNVKFTRSKELRIKEIQGKTVLHTAHIYEFEFQVVKKEHEELFLSN